MNSWENKEALRASQLLASHSTTLEAARNRELLFKSQKVRK
jgi:hypothetical protein